MIVQGASGRVLVLWDTGVFRILYRGVVDSMHTKRMRKILRPCQLLSTTPTKLRLSRPFRGVHYQESNLISLSSKVQEAAGDELASSCNA